MDIMEPEKKDEKPGERVENKDRLSDLPDCLLLCILTLVSSKDAVATCILSRRWEHLWRCLPILVLHKSCFTTKKIFDKFVLKLLHRRDPVFALHTLDFKCLEIAEPRILRRVIGYAVSNEVRQLAIEANVDFDRLPIFSSIFSCRTLTYLKLSVLNKDQQIGFPKSLDLPALTSLVLWNIMFLHPNDNGHPEPFKTLNKLNTLVLYECSAIGRGFLITSTTLSSLTICQSSKFGICEFRLSTPNLCSFALGGSFQTRMHGSILSSVKRVEVDANILNGCLKPPLFG